MRTCYTCKRELTLDCFPRKKNKPEGRSYQCSECNYAAVLAWRAKNPEKHLAQVMRHRAKHPDQQRNRGRKYAASEKGKTKIRSYILKTRYGLSPDAYDAMLAAQNARCAICQTDKPGRGNKHFQVDHCHSTGAIRGLLCVSCNTGIGSLKHNPATLLKAVEYLSTRLA